ncbi:MULTISPECIES: phosphate ABC transporter permease PstA [unclassified Halanaerobium]|uniref:phosphate ABC transporter permease PstA n=1 Tax=unclassified Halanaerobium TaxID=2641197 RepID=UPI000DF41957|nr:MULTISPECIES: phosphate ABC transporter permease PstA [unclassified Halanaerobium]RCW49954.1 phosphate ABC transporter membrane protein 2 (PhoT family) [Halanaerobium sp. MA284_MarDTE_T2]RCW81095.1 phosphate ABC transporter membrane protein 2 (PhoT family) [Halanaerobium sp. DL-01]
MESKLIKRKLTEKVIFNILGLFLWISIAILGIIIFFIFKRGIGVISWEFITSMPANGMTEGGIFPAILGSFYLVSGSILFATPLGVFAAIYMTEYAKKGRLIRLIRIGVNNLAGVPSVVFGLFGLAVFVKYLNFGVSILSGALTLAIVILPTIIRASEEALISVPDEYRESSLALGATKWQTIKNVVLPAAIPGILTGCILGVGRVAGETAPIIFTAATFFSMKLPNSVFSEVMALPYHIYALVTTGTFPAKQVPFAYGTAVVLLVLVLLINLAAIILRIRYSKKFSN